MADEQESSTLHNVESLTAPARRGAHPNSLANLKRFPKGVNPNPGGRKVNTLSAALREILTPAKAKLVAEQLVIEALSGNIKAMALIFDRLEGKARQQLDITSNGETIKAYPGVDLERV